VLFTLDLRRSAGPRGDHFDDRKGGMQRLVEDLAATSDAYRMIEVDYSGPAVERVGEQFFGGARPPTKDCFGAPFFGYFYGLACVETRYVLHMDCDMLFGGGSGEWVAEAIALMCSRPEVLFMCPLAGPPTVDARLPRKIQRAQRRTQEFGSAAVLECLDPRTYRLRHATSRVFFTDMARLREAGPFAILDAGPWTYGSDLATTPFLPAETVLSKAIHDGDYLRLDYLGRGRGMWFLHPPQRGPSFATNLPNLVAALEADAVPAAQRGSFDLVDSWLDSVGPARFQRPRTRLTARTIAKRVGSASGLLVLREGLRRRRRNR
jgi:hypothetical protein